MAQTRKRTLKRYQKVDRRLRPDMSQITQVTSQIQVLGLGPIEDLKEEFHLSLFLRLNWSDPRLKFQQFKKSNLKYKNCNISDSGQLRLNSKTTEDIWTPDIFFSNAKQAYLHNQTMKNVMVRIFEDGTVETSTRLSLVLTCNMNFEHFPFDVHVCSMKFASYQYNTNEMRLSWMAEAFQPKKMQDLKSSNSLRLLEFNLKNVSNGHYISNAQPNINSNSRSTLKICFKFERDLRYYLFSSFLFPFMLVCTSQISFWINKEATPARMTFGTMTFLALTLFTISERQFVPKVSYVMAYDKFIVGCYVFVSTALIEFAVVNYVGVTKPKRIRELADHVIHSWQKKRDNTICLNEDGELPAETKFVTEGDKKASNSISDPMHHLIRKAKKENRNDSLLHHLNHLHASTCTDEHCPDKRKGSWQTAKRLAIERLRRKEVENVRHRVQAKNGRTDSIVKSSSGDTETGVSSANRIPM